VAAGEEEKRRRGEEEGREKRVARQAKLADVQLTRLDICPIRGDCPQKKHTKTTCFRPLPQLYKSERDL